MTDTGVVLYDAGLVLRVVRALGERSLGLVPRENFVYDNIRNMYFVKYYVLASITLLYFDHALTIQLEVRRVWCTRFTGASLLFLLNRYVPFFGFIPILLSLFNPPWTIAVCRHFSPFVGALSLICNVISAIILILRTYALYARALWVLLITGSIGAVSIAVGAWSASSVQGELFNFRPIVTCVPMLIQDRGLKFAWITTFCFDFVVFGLTIARTYRYMKAQSQLQLHNHLNMLLMRDGSIYFLVMSIVNAMNYILAVKLENSFFASATGTNSILANVISVTMISRLLLNLREETLQYNRRTSGDHDIPTVQTHTDTNLIFTSRILGSLTNELDYGEDSIGFRTDVGSENYYSYDFSGDGSDEVYELRSRSTRTGTTTRSGYSGRTISTEPGSSSGSGTVAGLSSGSGSRPGRNPDKEQEGERGYSRLAWTASVNTAFTSAGTRHPRGEPQTPVTTVGATHGLLPAEGRSPQPLLPTSPATVDSTSPTLIPSIHSRQPPTPITSSDHWETGDNELERHDTRKTDHNRSSEDSRRQLGRSHIAEHDEAVELPNRQRRSGDGSGREHDLFNSHNRWPSR